MALMSLRDVSVAFGGPQLLDGVTLHVEADERICLLGRNGAGKSTLLKVLAGALGPDQGKLEVRQGLRVAMLEQEVPAGREVKLAELVQRGLAVEDRETAEGARRVEEILSRFELEGTTSFAPLSAGNKRRVLLARALVGQPDILLLDEPTNHLDIPSVEWMEQLLRRFEGTVVFVSHDRAFVRKLATRVVELDRGQ
ncbi:MAG: ATP-binding cassette domain-containing protein, partial [Myxococcota bacterium]